MFYFLNVLFLLEKSEEGIKGEILIIIKHCTSNCTIQNLKAFFKLKENILGFLIKAIIKNIKDKINITINM